MTQREIERTCRRFEGLVHTTALQIVEQGVELELDDIKQLLRIKVWQSVMRFNQTRTTRMDLRRWVFGCMYNLRKDIEKRPRRYNASIDRLRESDMFADQDGGSTDRFDAKYLAVDAEQVFAEAEEEPVELPSTLTSIERRVVELRLEGRQLQEIDRELGLSRARRERVMQSVREKLADWKPGPAPRSVPMRPLPGAEPQPARARAALAA